MTDQVQQQSAAGQQQQPQPELIAGKFKTQDELVASYKALESKVGELTSKKPAPAPASDGLSIQPVQPSKVLEDAYNKRAQGAELSAEDYAVIEKAGISRAVADTFFDGRDAVFEKAKAKVHAIAGTEEDYKNLLTWASTNMAKDEIDAFNATMQTKNLHQMSLAVAGLKARHSQAFGVEMKSLGGERTQFSSVKPYSNAAEFHKDTGNPKYRSDETFRAEVKSRLAASVKAGTIKQV